MSFDVSSEQFKHCDLVKASGRIDSQTAPELGATFNEITDAGRFNIVFDMSDVQFISSAGLRVLINTQKTCQRLNRGEVVLVSVPERIHEVLDIAGFLPLFRLVDDVVSAVGSF